MKSEFTFPYRRFSSDLYATSLMALLDENKIEFDIVSEPEGIGSVFIGESAVPGVILMVKPEDAKRIQSLESEKTLVPVETLLVEEEKTKSDLINPIWILIGYLMCVVMAPVSIIFGLHLFSAKRRNADFTYSYAYTDTIRKHGYIIFLSALLVFGYCLVIMVMSPRHSNILYSFSWVLHYFRYR